ncbi:MAG TPA: AI-2E family transporter [Trichormus sp.]|jgi:predicted PurR-regulated permease PerM
MDNTRNVQVATLKVIGLVLGALLAVWLIVQLQVLIVNLLIALTLASAIAPVAEWGEKRGISRSAMLLVVYLSVCLTYTVMAFALAPAVKAQASQLYLHLPVYLASVTSWFQTVIGGLAGDQAQSIKVDSELVHNVAMKLGHETLDMTAGLLGLVLNGLLVLFLTAYFVVEAKSIWEKLLVWLPPGIRPKVTRLIRPLGARMGGYVRGQILVSLAVSAFLGIGLTLLKVNYSIVLGVLAGLLNLVPFVGSLSACVFAVVVAANQNIWLAGAVLGLFAFEQWCESNFIVPYLLGRHVEMHPIIVLFAVLIGASLLGVPGALVAVPVTSAALFLAQEFYLKPMNAKAELGITVSAPPAALEITHPHGIIKPSSSVTTGGDNGKHKAGPHVVIEQIPSQSPADKVVASSAIDEELTA